MDLLLPHNLLAWAIQAGLVVLVAAPLPRLLGLWSPRSRMAYWRAVLVACLLLPALQSWTVREASAPRPTAGAGVDVVGRAAGDGEDQQPAAPATDAASRPWPLPVGVKEVLLGGIALRLAWLAIGVLTVRRLRRSARPLWPRPPSVDRAASLAETDAEFLVSATASRPVTCGLIWPVVLVPRDFESFPEHEQTAIACHELLHVSRVDWARNASDEVLRALLWFHPAIWWLINEIQLAREQVVDRESVRLLGTRQPYLEALLRLAKPAPRLVLTPASLFLKRAHLRQRVTLLVKEVSMSRARIVSSLAVMGVVVFAAGGLATAAFPLEQSTAARPGTQADTQKPVPGATKPGMPTVGAAGGVPGGVAGGIAGGVPGGVAGGAAGGVAGGVPGDFARQTWAQPMGEGTSTLVSRTLPASGEHAGTARVYVTIDPSGRVSSVDFVSGGGEQQVAAAIAAARGWVFEPSPLPERRTVIAFNFGAQGGASPELASVRIGGQIPPPNKLVDVKPVYPKEAADARIQGVQILEVEIDPAGNVIDARALRGSRILIGAAIDAVMQWKFTPWPGPERRLMTVTVNFTLADGPEPAGIPAQPTADGGTAAQSPVPFGRATDWPPEAGRVGANLPPPAKVVDVKPVYPDAAQKARVQGVVIFDVLIGPDGKVKDARLLRSIPMLDEAGYAAVRQWEFTPTVVNGEKVPVVMTVTVNFTLK
jgi:TonB family protein